MKRDEKGVYQECPKCGHRTYDGDEKHDAVASGEWEATKESAMSDMVSYRISGLVSPYIDWKTVHEQYELARKGGVTDLRALYNNFLGLPYTSRKWSG